LLLSGQKAHEARWQREAKVCGWRTGDAGGDRGGDPQSVGPSTCPAGIDVPADRIAVTLL
jgi:hypothetical protein